MMADRVTGRDEPELQRLRKEAGVWLRGLRENAGHTQRSLAAIVASDYYTFISQIENGRGRVPPDKYVAWARALGVEPRAFVRELMRYYEPNTYDILFGDQDPAAGETPAKGQ